MGGRGAGAGVKAEGGGHRRSLGDKAVGEKVAGRGGETWRRTGGRREEGKRGHKKECARFWVVRCWGSPTFSGMGKGRVKSSHTAARAARGCLLSTQRFRNTSSVRGQHSAIHLFGCSEGRAMQDQGCEEIKRGRGYLDRCSGNSFEPHRRTTAQNSTAAFSWGQRGTHGNKIPVALRSSPYLLFFGQTVVGLRDGLLGRR